MEAREKAARGAAYPRALGRSGESRVAKADHAELQLDHQDRLGGTAVGEDVELAVREGGEALTPVAAALEATCDEIMLLGWGGPPRLRVASESAGSLREPRKS